MIKIKNKIKKEWYEITVLLRSIPALVMTFFVISIVLMNLLANKSLITNSEYFAFDGGFCISWIAFLSMDILVKRFGPKATNQLTIIATFINLIIALILITVSNIPGEWSQSFVENGDIINKALDNTFAGTWYVLLGSTVAFISSAFVNNFINWSIGKILKNKNSYKSYMIRSFISTMIAQLVDNLIFAFIVSLNFFGWSILQCVVCSICGAIFELVLETIFSPIGYKITKKWDELNIGSDYINLINEENKNENY